jgi:hypothetical protein
MLLIECGLVLVAVFVAFTFPSAGAHFFECLCEGQRDGVRIHLCTFEGGLESKWWTALL